MKVGHQLEVVSRTEIQETLLPQLHVFAPVEFNSALRASDCIPHRFGNAADHLGHVPRYPSDMTDAEWAMARPLLLVPG
jgi:hypothetical protein